MAAGLERACREAVVLLVIGGVVVVVVVGDVRALVFLPVLHACETAC